MKTILEAERQEQINKASGEAAAMLAVADARAKGLAMVAQSLMLKDGKNAASFSVAEQYVNAFNKLARTNNTLILPANAADVSSLVGQAMTIYQNLSRQSTRIMENEENSADHDHKPRTVGSGNVSGGPIGFNDTVDEMKKNNPSGTNITNDFVKHGGP